MNLGAAMCASGDAPARGEMAEAALLLRLGWTYQEYLDTPDSVVLQMMTLLNAEAEYQKSQIPAGRG